MNLLVVEDDARLNRLLRRMLSQDRNLVETALTAEEGLAAAVSNLALDAIILDVGLPDRSGLDVARTLRSGGSTVPILFLTARDSVGDRAAGFAAGADDYLVKPFSYEELLARLRALVPRRPSRTAGPLKVEA